MKFLTPITVKIIVLILTVINLSVAVLKLFEAGFNGSTVLTGLLFQTVLIILYVTYVSNVVWQREFQSLLLNKLNSLIDQSRKFENDLIATINNQDQIVKTLHNLEEISTKYEKSIGILNVTYKSSFEAFKKASLDYKEELSDLIKIESEEKYKLLQNQLNFTYNRIDALFSIYKLIDIRSPLPVMEDWAITSEYGRLLIKTILDQEQSNVIDIGSGISTILMGYAVEKKGVGKIISIEHDSEYYKKTQSLIKAHQLEQFVELFLCPLKINKIGDEEWLWYDISKIPYLKQMQISLISIDGPPGDLQEQSRFPALPTLYSSLSSGAIILIDDAKRKDEQEIVQRWKKLYDLDGEFIDSLRGIYKFEKR